MSQTWVSKTCWWGGGVTFWRPQYQFIRAQVGTHRVLPIINGEERDWSAVKGVWAGGSWTKREGVLGESRGEPSGPRTQCGVPVAEGQQPWVLGRQGGQAMSWEPQT